jgi:hypothetical protein
MPSANNEDGGDERKVGGDDQRAVCATQASTRICANQRQGRQAEVRAGDERSLPRRRTYRSSQKEHTTTSRKSDTTHDPGQHDARAAPSIGELRVGKRISVHGSVP